jgi:hypothetical protein
MTTPREHPTMLRRLSIAFVPVAVTVFMLGAVGAPGEPQARTAQLTITVVGKGTVTVGRYRVACASTTACSKSYVVNTGAVVRLKVSAAPTWKFTTWGGGCRGQTTTCVLHVRRSTRLSATFVPPGVPENPVALGHAGCSDVQEYADRLRPPCWGDWSLRVVDTTPDATSEVLAADRRNPAPPPGFQDYLIRVAATPAGPNENLQELVWSIFAANASNPHPSYAYNYYTPVYNACGSGTLPAPDLLKQGVFLDQVGIVVPDTRTVTGNICFLVSSDDASRLLLYTEPTSLDSRWNGLEEDPFQRQPPDRNAVWFALR